MDRKIVLGLSVVILLALAVAILIPGGRTTESQPRLPWQINVDAEGDSTIFGLTLMRSTLNDAQQLFQAQGKTNLFVSKSGDYALESYFQRLTLSGLRADIVLTYELQQDTAEAMYQRGLRISQLGSGTKKVDLSVEDRQVAGTMKIRYITYLPAADLDEALIRQHFGVPKQQIAEDSGVMHWLYPEKGLDIAVNPEGKEVFQYLPTQTFEQSLSVLIASGATHSR